MNAQNPFHPSPSTSGATGPVHQIRLSDPAALVHAVPLLLGVQHLNNDLALLATQARTTVLTARIDLSALPDGVIWASVQHALATVGAENVHLVAFPPEPVNDQTLRSLHHDLAHLAATAPAGLTIGWAVTSAHGYWWVHDLTGPAPSGPGTADRDDPSVELALTLVRGIPAGTRHDIEAATASHPPQVLAAVRQALDALPQNRRRSHRRRDANQALRAHQERPLDWDIPDAAGVLDALTDIQVRDELVIRSDEAPTTWTWCTLLPYAPPAWVAPVATLAAFAAYQPGHSILARSALTRALNADPDYTLARLLYRAMEMAMSPQDIREYMAPAQAEIAKASEADPM